MSSIRGLNIFSTDGNLSLTPERHHVPELSRSFSRSGHSQEKDVCAEERRAVVCGSGGKQARIIAINIWLISHKGSFFYYVLY